MRVLHGVADAGHERQALLRRGPVPLEPAVDALTLHQLHRQEGARSVLGLGDPGLKDAGDAWVAQPSQDLGLVLEASQALLGDEPCAQELQRHAPARVLLLGLVDHAHSALADDALDDVAADPPRRALRPRVERVEGAPGRERRLPAGSTFVGREQLLHLAAQRRPAGAFARQDTLPLRRGQVAQRLEQREGGVEGGVASGPVHASAPPLGRGPEASRLVVAPRVRQQADDGVHELVALEPAGRHRRHLLPGLEQDLLRLGRTTQVEEQLAQLEPDVLRGQRRRAQAALGSGDASAAELDALLEPALPPRERGEETQAGQGRGVVLTVEPHARLVSPTSMLLGQREPAGVRVQVAQVVQRLQVQTVLGADGPLEASDGVEERGFRLFRDGKVAERVGQVPSRSRHHPAS